MGFNYAQKRAIIDFLSDAGHWRNVFDMDFFLDKRRKWRHRTERGIAVETAPEGNPVILSDRDSGTTLLLEKQADGTVRMQDERGRVIQYDPRTGGWQSDNAGPAWPVVSPREMGLDDRRVKSVWLEDLRMAVRFSKLGWKTLFFERTNEKIVMDNHDAEPTACDKIGSLFHTVSIDAGIASRVGMDMHALMEAMKLIVARDLSVEPDLLAFNTLDPDKAIPYTMDLMTDSYDMSWEGPSRWRPKITKTPGDMSRLQKTWHDSTEFEGYYTATPRRFCIERTDDGYRLRLSLDDREAVLAQSSVLHKAAAGETARARTITAKASPDSLLRVLAEGVPARDHRDREWTYVAVESKQSARLAQAIREMVRDELALTGHDCLTVSYDNRLCVIGISVEALEKLRAQDSRVRAETAALRRGKSPLADTPRVN